MLERESPFGIYVLLHILCVCPSRVRYYYLGKSIHLVLCNGADMSAQELYPVVAKIFDVSLPAIAAGLRLAVEDCVTGGDACFLEDITGGCFYHSVPTMDFINLTASYLTRSF